MPTKLLLPACAVLLLAATATAEPVPTRPNTPQLVQDADLIIRGRAITIGPGKGAADFSRISSIVGPTSIPDAEAVTIAVDQTLEGTLPANAHSVTFTYHHNIGAGNPVASGEYGIYFLRRDPTDGWVTADPWFPGIDTLPGPASVSDADPLTLIARQLIRTLAASPQQLLDPRQGIHAPMVASSGQTKAAILYGEASSQLDQIPIAIVEAPLHDLIAGPDFPGRLWAIQALLAHGDQSVLKLVKPIMLNPDNDNLDIVKSLAFTINYKPGLPADIPTLAQLLHSPVVEVRRGAAANLRYSRTPAALKPLSSALDDNDQMTRYYAVTGLALNSGQLNHLVSVDYFQKNESEQLSYWKTWSQDPSHFLTQASTP